MALLAAPAGRGSGPRVGASEARPNVRDAFGLFSGARQLAKVFVIIHLLFAGAFLRARTSLPAESAGGRV